jgi:hypothetical protein
MSESTVVLLVYDITMGMARGMSMMMIGQQIDAVYHTSLVAYGREYYFGGGICNDAPKTTPYGKPIQEIALGHTEIPKEVFEDFLKDIAPRFTAEKYDIIEHNCNMFTDQAAEFLTGKGIGDKYVKQAKELLETPAGQMFKPFLAQMQGQVQNPPPAFYY